MRAGVVAAAVLAGAAATAGCGGESAARSDVVRVGVVTSTSGPLATYGRDYLEGFELGLRHATGGDRRVGDRRIQLVQRDDAGDPAKGVAAARELIGDGVKILAGPTVSSVSLQIAPVAEQNRVLFISGSSASDDITGINRYTFRAGRQTFQDMRTASAGGDRRGQRVLVFAQDTDYGQSSVAAVRSVFGAQGASVDALLVPQSANDVTPFARRVRERRPDFVVVVWAGTSVPAMWRTLDQQDIFAATQVVTLLELRSSLALLGPSAEKVGLYANYFAEAPRTRLNRVLVDGLAPRGELPEFTHPDGFVTAQMIVRAVQASGDDVDAMVRALEGWRFEAPKGQQTVRASDHAMLQPMYRARLMRRRSELQPRVVEALEPAATAPPER